MKYSRLLITPIAAGLLALSACGPGYTTVGVGADIGPGVDVYGYSPDYWGDWHSQYLNWSPVVVYDYNGHYYPTRIRGSRPVQVYRTQRGYVLPPRGDGWNDRRFNKKQIPNDRDYGRARPHP